MVGVLVMTMVAMCPDNAALNVEYVLTRGGSYSEAVADPTVSIIYCAVPWEQPKRGNKQRSNAHFQLSARATTIL